MKGSKHVVWMIGIVLMGNSCMQTAHKLDVLNKEYTSDEPIVNNKFVIYQTLVRHFGNTNLNNKLYGSLEENGVGKFNDYTDTALQKIKDLGATHIWYTGVIEHATMTDYSAYGIAVDDPDVVKGRAGSPYAIKDYYDVNPDFAIDVKQRMNEFEALIERTHKHQLKVIIDFVPNHVSRTYRSDSKPEGVKDFGEEDDTRAPFSAQNDFYYLKDEPLVVPGGYQPGGTHFSHPLADGKFDEFPAKVTGNDKFSAQPSLDDWFETVKLNYGVDIQQGHQQYFDPIPKLWFKMKDILEFWASKGVDGFRCDMVEMVPVEFWNWAISEVRKTYPDLIFIGEAYDKNKYATFYDVGKFDYLYDKVGLYDTLKVLMRHEDRYGVKGIQDVWQNEVKGYSSRMLRFLENHDEQRIASQDFLGDPNRAKAGMIVSATLSTGPVLIYSGQEVGEPGAGVEGFGGKDGRTTIFDYWGVPQLQKWVNDKKFDGGGLSELEKELRGFYQKLLYIAKAEHAIASGGFYDLSLTQEKSGEPRRAYAYLRYTDRERILVIANFDRTKTDVTLRFPDDVIEAFGLDSPRLELTDLLTADKKTIDNCTESFTFDVPSNEGLILKF